MRIAMASCVYPPYKSGIGNIAALHAHQLTRLGHEVEVFVPAHNDPVGTSKVDGIVVHREQPLIRHGNSALVPTLVRRVGAFDALYVMYPFFGGAELAVAGARSRGIPYAVFFHMDVTWQGWRGHVLRAYDRTVEPWLMRGAHRVLASSSDYATSSSLARIRGLQVIDSPYSVDLTRFSPPAAGSGPSSDAPSVLFVGAMDSDHAFKGIPELIAALARVRRTVPTARLDLVGDGDLRPRYEALVRSAAIGDAVTFHGRVPDEALAPLYRSATTTVLPSVAADEAFGVVMVEGMACGTPTVASALPGVRAVVQNGGGLLVTPGDVDALTGALERMLTEPGLRANLSARALDGLTRYSDEAERERLALVFESMPTRRRRR